MTPSFPGPIALAEEIAERYRRYLKTTFYFRDPDLRSSFAEALDRDGSLANGPLLEASSLYRRSSESQVLVRELLGADVEPGLIDALNPTRRLYTH